MNRFTILALLCGTWLLGSAFVQAANGDSVKSAKIEVIGMPAIPLEVSENWRKAPDFLPHATIYFSPEAPSGVLNFKVLEPGLVVLAASFSYDGNQIDEPWTDDCKTFVDLTNDGWTPIGVLNSPKTSRHYLFRKVVKSGENYQIQTRFRFPPYAIVVPDADVGGVMAVKPWVASSRKTPMILAPADSEPKGQSPNASTRAVSLKFHDPVPSVLYMRFGILLREIVHQGVALAANEQLGIPTRDITLREPFPGDTQPGIGPLDVVTVAQPLNAVDIAIYQQRGKIWEAVWDDGLRLPPKDLYENLTGVVEKLSRTEFVDMLKRCGYQGTALPPARDTAPLPEGVEKLQGELTVPDQFGAVRVLHGEICKNGESPELLGALARGYAMLGVLTEDLWSAAHKAFKARALLYAERAARAWPKSALALENRAYVRALIGLHRTALEDLAAAAELRKGENKSDGADAAAPVWTKAIAAFCKFDADALEAEAKDESNTVFVRLLQLMTAEYSHSERDIFQASGALMQAAPSCLRAIDGLCEVQQLGTYRMATAYGPRLADKELLNQVARVPDLPAEAAKLIAELQKRRKISGVAQLLGATPPDEMSVRLKVIDSLREAGSLEHDSADPSWQVLAQLLEEIDFIHAWREVNVAVKWLGVPGDEIIESVKPQVAHHPYGKYIESLQSDPQKSRAALQQLSSTIDTSTLQFCEAPMIGRIDSVVPNWSLTHWPLGFCNEDLVAPDLCSVMKNAKEPHLIAFQLQEASPNLPFGVAAAIAQDIGNYRSRLAEIEKQFAKSAVVQAALGKYYYEKRNTDDAIRCFQAAIDLEPAYDSYYRLAAIYLEQGDEDKWLATLEDFLKTESLGLTHAQVQVQIAKHFMEKRDWKKARTYADEAVQCGSGWAMLCAAECAEAMQDWPVAEQWYRSLSERYNNSAHEWFEFCKRTGQGDQQQSLELAMNFVRRAEVANTESELWVSGGIRTLNQQTKEAAQDYEKAFPLSHSSSTALSAALAYDELGDAEGRDRILNQVHELHDRYKKDELTQAYVALCELIREESAGGATPKIDLDAIDKIVNGVSPGLRSDIRYFSGKYLNEHGQPEKAVEYWKGTMNCNDIHRLSRTLAGAALWDRGITPASYMDALTQKNEATDAAPAK